MDKMKIFLGKNKWGMKCFHKGKKDIMDRFILKGIRERKCKEKRRKDKNEDYII
ncbi:hypothetical protein IX329_001020 [Fusobacterium necrophorum]|nr:hypothetical protein [Fusobacterium necrophorum]MBR8789623.1 hypothetical protein [Fusobacterium necrophorum]